MIDQQKYTHALSSTSALKQLILAIFLVVIPLAIVINQSISSFQIARENKKRLTQVELEKFAARFATQASKELQINNVLDAFVKEYWKMWFEHMGVNESINILQNIFPERVKFVKYNYNIAYSKTSILMEKNLRKLIPGLKIIKWNENYKMLPSSDIMTQTWPYTTFLKLMFLFNDSKKSIKKYHKNYYPIQQLQNKLDLFLGKDSLSKRLIHCPNKVFTIQPANGRNLFIYWDFETYKYVFPGSNLRLFGFFFVIDNNKLPELYQMKLMSILNKDEWAKSRNKIGWINPENARTTYLPGLKNDNQSEKWFKWLRQKPTGSYEKDNYLIAINRINHALAIVTYKSKKSINDIYNRKIFTLFFFITTILLVPVLVLIKFRKNGGLALSLKFQILGILLMTVGIPSLAIYQFGSELLENKKIILESNAFRELENIKSIFERNYNIAFDKLRSSGNELTKKLAAIKSDFSKEDVFKSGKTKNIFQRYCDEYKVTNLYLFDDTAKQLICVQSNKDKTGALGKLIETIAGLKLRGVGKFKTVNSGFKSNLMGTFLEESGGTSINNFKKVFKSDKPEAFELGFSNRKLNVYINVFSQDSFPDKSFVLIAFARDSHFELLYLKSMINTLLKEKKLKNKIQIYFSSTDLYKRKPFNDTNLKQKDAWFDYETMNEDSKKMLKKGEGTRISGTSYTSRISLGSPPKKFLFYSFKPARVQFHFVSALYNYSIIENQIHNLSIVIVLIFLFSVFISLVLAKLASRSLLEPINLLKQGVKDIENHNYNSTLFMPGQDEFVELANSFNSMAKGLGEREKMTKYLSKSAVESVKQNAETHLGGKKVKAAILFSDIRSFTTLSESHSAEEVVSLLNSYFSCMNQVIENNKGDIDKFIGDAIMAQFISHDQSLSDREIAINSVNCGIEMMKALSKFNAERKKHGKFPLGIGVGINFGEVITGNIGSPGRMDHTVIGDTVNVASRLEGMSKKGHYTHIIISKSMLELVSDKIEFEKLKETAVKGKLEEVEMYEVIGWKTFN